MNVLLFLFGFAVNITLAVNACSCDQTMGKLNLGYKASNEPNMMYRALQIRKPSPELSGEYKCIVSTFSHEASQSKKMVIFVPQKDFRFWHTIDLQDRDDNSVEQLSTQISVINVTCVAEGVFPEPVITILSASEPVDKPSIKMKKRNGLYDVTASFQMESAGTEDDERTFECELSIPETNYTVKKVLYVTPEYSSIEETTTEEMSSTSTTEDPYELFYYNISEISSTTAEYSSSTLYFDDWEFNSTESNTSSPIPDSYDIVDSNEGQIGYSSAFVIICLTIVSCCHLL